MEALLLVIVLQFLFQVSRTKATLCISEKNQLKSTIWAGIVMIFWLATTYLGVKAIDEGNWVTVIGYLAGGCAGVWTTFYFHKEPILKFEGPEPESNSLIKDREISTFKRTSCAPEGLILHKDGQPVYSLNSVEGPLLHCQGCSWPLASCRCDMFEPDRGGRSRG